MTSTLNVRLPPDLKLKLEQEAAKDNMEFSQWLRLHLSQLKAQYPQIEVLDTIKVPNPTSPYGFLPSYNPNPYTSQYSQTFPQYPYSPYQQIPDELDLMMRDLRRIAMAQMLFDFLKGKESASAMIQAFRGGDGQPKQSDGGGFDWNKMMQYQQMQSMFDREQARLQYQLEMARAKGDKPGEANAVQAITALIAAQGAQSQTFMQQLMAMNTMANQTQQNMFTTAMQTQHQTTLEGNQERAERDQAMAQLRQEFNATQLANLQANMQLQLNWANQEMERIKTGQGKDTLTQIADLLALREKSPVYKAAFDAAFGVKEESAIGKLIPQLKDLGVDKLVERIGGFLTGLVMPKPAAPLPMPLPPTPATGVIPPPAPINEQALAQLRLPTSTPTATQPSQQTYVPPPLPNRPMPPTPAPLGYSNLGPATQQPTPPASPPEPLVGYTNLRPEEPTVTVETTQPTEIVQIEQEEVTIEEPTLAEEALGSFTVGRKPGSKDKTPRKRKTPEEPVTEGLNR